MADPQSEGSPEHIDELLSQLKGIFGHLSESEQEEAKRKITPPPVHTPVPPSEPEAAAPPEKKLEPKASFPDPEPAPLQDPFGAQPLPAVTAEAAAEPPLEGAGDPASMPLEAWVPPAGEAAPASTPDFKATEVIVPPGATLIPTAVLYPSGRTTESKTVTGKVEQITPKFTKVAVVINVQAHAPYDAKSDLKTHIISQIRNPRIKAVFVLVEKPLDDARRKAILAELEPRGVYFQEIPLTQIEKKALYMDMLLGMVFFFDSQKPAGEAPAA